MFADENSHPLVPVVPESRQQVAMPDRKDERVSILPQLFNVLPVHNPHAPGMPEKLQKSSSQQ